MTDVEQLLKDCGELKNDLSKCAKTRSVARTTIEICHGVIDLKEENERLRDQVKHLRALLGEPPEEGRCAGEDCISPAIPDEDYCENCFDVLALEPR